MLTLKGKVTTATKQYIEFNIDSLDLATILREIQMIARNDAVSCDAAELLAHLNWRRNCRRYDSLKDRAANPANIKNEHGGFRCEQDRPFVAKRPNS